MTATQVDRAASSPSLAARLAGLVGEAAACLGIRPGPEAVASDVLALVRDPLTRFERHPVWPSLLTATGLPLELSLKLGGGPPALRCAVDVTDHRVGAEANWSGYLDYAEGVAGPAGATARDLWELCRLHLNGVPSGFRSRMMHGLGYAAPDWYRGSLYFRTGWLRPEQLAKRFPDEMALLAELRRLHGFPAATSVEVLGYDYSAGDPVRPKVYVWPGRDCAATFEDVAGRHPHLLPARDLFDAFRRDGTPRARSQPLLLQAAVEKGAVTERLFFFASAWGWDSPAGFGRLVGFLDEELGIEIGPLSAVRDLAAAHGVRLPLGLVAVGSDGRLPSATFYLWPVPDRGGPHTNVRRRALSASRPPSRSALLRRTELALERGAGYLEALLSREGCWRDYDVDPAGDVPPGNRDAAPSDVFVTAYVASMLVVGDVARLANIARPAAWLLAGYRPGLGWGWNAEVEPDSETTALALAALAKAGSPLPADTRDVLLRGRLPDGSSCSHPGWAGDSTDGCGPPDVTAAILLALLEAAPREIGAALPALVALCQAQRADGGWRCFWWSDGLQATWRALRALRAYEEAQFAGTALGQGSRLLARRAVERALSMLSALPVPRDPFRLGLWLGSWIEAGGEVGATGRVITALEDLQQPDGRWLGTPSRRIARGGGKGRERVAEEMYVDGACLVTTATVVGCLRAMLAAERPGGRR